MFLIVNREMEKSSSRNALAAQFLAIFFVYLQCLMGEAGSNVRAMLVFGDSLVDDGNNNFLNSLARANYYPYGIDYNQGETGRFCNGKTVVDWMVDLLGLPCPPAYADPNTKGSKILGGVNYASAAAGILDETGTHFGDRFTLSQQVLNFENNLNDLRNQTDARTLGAFLAQSIVFLIIGSNDYINNYLLPSMYPSSYTYNPQQFADLLINHYTRQILALHSLGLRKFFIAGVAPLGCIPNQLATGTHDPGRCVNYVNQIVGPFNEGLKAAVDQLNHNHPGAIFAYANTFVAFADILNNPASYGFSVWDRGCCGLGRNQGQITCLPFTVPCTDRNHYIFWDAFHPTQAVNRILAQRAFYGPPSDCYPVNVQQMSIL